MKNPNMTPHRDLVDQALVNIYRAINCDERFPNNVFAANWTGFLFFDSDRLFDSRFAEIVNALLQIENGQCACLSNLDLFQSAIAAAESAIVIDKTMVGKTYLSLLNDGSPGEGWIHTADRFGCASDVGHWCIYCEKRNEIGVIALSKKELLDRYRAELTELSALPIREAIANTLSYGFSPKALSPEWCDRFLRQYK